MRALAGILLLAATAFAQGGAAPADAEPVVLAPADFETLVHGASPVRAVLAGLLSVRA